MCGIAGVLYADPCRPVDRGLLQVMGRSIAHRGPDAEGLWSQPGIGLVHRRLSIIDLAGGDQPIGNEDGTIQVVFNGEIYNFERLRDDLESRGHRFRTRSDTEVLVHLYEEKGDQLVESLRGMFAFALWDGRRRKLLLARDRLGIKPLYIYRDSEKLLFGSELKAILAHPGLSREIDPAALEDYLTYGFVPAPRTIFRQITKLLPAHVLPLIASNWMQEPRRYWRLSFETDHGRTAEDWKEAVRAKLTEAVRLHLIADVPVGAFLSGGMDSSIIVALASGATQGPLRTFSMGFSEQNFSELPYAREVAQSHGTQHTQEIVTPDAVALVDELTHFYDEPFADPSAVPTYLVSRLASRHVKVVLSGDGGDEAFGGYARYAHDLREARVRRCLPGWFRRQVLGRASLLWPKADWLPRRLRAKTLLTNLSLEPAAAYANTLAICRRHLRRQLLTPELSSLLNGHQPERAILTHHGTAPADDALAGMIAADVATVLPDDFLVKVDRASMAHGLEVRPPLLDHELLELAARIPSDLKIHGGQTKWILREAFANQLSPTIRTRPKQGFEIPVDSWFQGPLRSQFEESVLRDSGHLSGALNLATVEKVYRGHLAGTTRQGNLLWALLMLTRWSERYLRSEVANY